MPSNDKIGLIKIKTSITSSDLLIGDKNAVLIDELMKPRYMSMGAIERAEGFKLPSGSYFKGKNFLGNGTPTLLAFKKEAQNGN